MISDICYVTYIVVIVDVHFNRLSNNILAADISIRSFAKCT